MNYNQWIYEHKAGSSKAEKSKYREVCNFVREFINEHHREEFAGDITSDQAKERYTILIQQILTVNGLVVEGYSEPELIEMIYNSMAKYDFLTPYIEGRCGNLKDNPLFYTWEEINCNCFDDIEVVVAEEYTKLDQAFEDPRACEDMVKRIARIGGLNLDRSNPQGNSFIGNSIRIEAAIAPCVDPEDGAIFSIRRQKSCTNEKDFFINNGTASKEELDLLILFLNNKIPVGISGDTGTGKTALMNYLLYNSSDTNRKVTIEDTRELNGLKKDENGKYRSRVVHLVTRESENEGQAVTADDLLRAALRLHPDIIGLGEMRGKEAKTTIMAGNTGHTILTGLHAFGQASAYRRMATLYAEGAGNMDKQSIYENIVEAIPIIVQMEAFATGERRISSISEAALSDNPLHTEVKFNILYEYIVTGYERDNDELIRVVGDHVKVGNLSDGLAQKLYRRGVPLETIKIYARPDFEPHKGRGGFL